MANDLTMLNKALFRELERIEGCETPEEIECECQRAEVVAKLASNIIGNANTMLRAVQMSERTAEQVRIPRALVGGSDG